MKFLSIIKMAFGACLLLLCISCGNNGTDAKKNRITPKQKDAPVEEVIEMMLSVTNAKNSRLDDSTRFYALPVLNFHYKASDFKAIWSSDEKWNTIADTLITYLQQCETDGLFKEDYQFAVLQSLKENIDKDSLKRKDARQWARADLLLTDAYVHLLQDLKQGRLQPDSLAWKYKAAKHESFFKVWLYKIINGDSLSSIVKLLQPSLKEYRALKKSIPAFIDSMDKKKYTYLVYPYKDSAAFIKKLVTRLHESGIAAQPVLKLDSAKLSQLIIKYQKAKGLKPSGKLSAPMVQMLNNTDQEKLKRIAITLDKYKHLPAKLPEKYIWVNLPSYKLEVWDKDTMVLESKVIIGKPATPTPYITSEISDMVIYPTWTVPNSIIVKDLLPGLKKNPAYLARKGLGLFNSKGEPVDPLDVNWARYTKGIPYYVRQNSGDNNALGVIKFNFNNPYAVYLHDTNQRYLFKNKSRSLSHGCVRVQDWQKLAFYIVRNDSMHSPQPDTLNFNTDSITSWIAQKELHRVNIRKRIPLFIRYLSCEGLDGKIKFYEDVYGEDKACREKYFALK